MKKIFAIIVVIMTAMAAISCGTSSKVQSKALDVYTGIGYGESMDYNNARDIAYNSAIAEIITKFGEDMTKNVEKTYNSVQSEPTRTNEVVMYSSKFAGNSEAHIDKAVITKENTRKEGNKWVSEMMVSVSVENVRR